MPRRVRSPDPRRMRPSRRRGSRRRRRCCRRPRAADDRVEFVGHERTSWMEFRPHESGADAFPQTSGRLAEVVRRRAGSVASAASERVRKGDVGAVPWAITASTTRFEARWVSGARWAIVSTMAATWSVWSAAGTTSSTKPIRSAREASIASAVNSAAWPVRGRRRRRGGGSPRAVGEAEVGRRHREGGVIGGDAKVGVERDGDAATPARAANRRDHRHRNRLDGLPGGVFGSVVALRLAPHSAVLELGDVATCRERKVTGAAKDDDAQIGFGEGDRAGIGHRLVHRAVMALRRSGLSIVMVATDPIRLVAEENRVDRVGCRARPQSCSPAGAGGSAPAGCCPPLPGRGPGVPALAELGTAR